ncbi:hypothetical protein D8674_031015 [Pyrus ussuriensis x Pyrus communis]|uniref:Ubiquitin-like protease family profile domain-containing protein n=1 Tax=Pyrus ussuriensis x Pyrus communis TaxID=2448454 RepID=A0A5N5EXV5_9ROSA|nr:hypothetical protein D8674_031015 [Pyrus ussuriensis x Pyrus communis]
MPSSQLLEGALSETFPSKVEGKAGEAEEQDGVELPYNMKRLQEYILGSRPPSHTLPWSQVLKVYVPYNLGGEHWVTAEVALVKQSIVLYDSLYDNTASKHIPKLCEPLTSALPRVLKHLDFYKTYEVGHNCGASTSKVYFPWKVTRP